MTFFVTDADMDESDWKSVLLFDQTKLSTKERIYLIDLAWDLFMHIGQVGESLLTYESI